MRNTAYLHIFYPVVCEICHKFLIKSLNADFNTNLLQIYLLQLLSTVYLLNAPPFIYYYKLDFKVFGMCPNNKKNNNNKKNEQLLNS